MNLTKLGFIIHPEKYKFEPSQKVIFLGYELDSIAIEFTEKRQNSLKHIVNMLLKINEPTVRFVSNVIGHIVSALPATKYGRLHYRKLEKDMTLGLMVNKGNFEGK